MNTAEPDVILVFLAVLGAAYCAYEILRGLKSERMNLILWVRSEAVKNENVGKFYALLLCFKGSMLGIVLSSNLLLMMIFWELTSLTS